MGTDVDHFHHCANPTKFGWRKNGRILLAVGLIGRSCIYISQYFHRIDSTIVVIVDDYLCYNQRDKVQSMLFVG